MGFARVENMLSRFNVKPKFRFENVRPNKTFIIPTKFGFLFAIQCLVIVVLAIGYGNNVLYFFVFFMIGAALVATVITNQNTERVQIVSCNTRIAFVNEPSLLNIKLKNIKSTAIYDLEVQVGDAVEGVSEIKRDVESRVRIPWVPKKRGEQDAPKILVRSRFPFGMTMSWKVFLPKTKIVVFPELKGDVQFPEGSEYHNVTDDIGVFMNHRDFVQGDSYRRVDWRASARQGDLLTKVFDGPRKNRVELHWDQTKHLSPFEERISQLALWVDLAEKEGYEYSLNIGTIKRDNGSGPEHFKNCLTTLALMKENSKLSENNGDQNG